MVSFHSADRTLTLKGRTKLKPFIEGIFKREGKRLSLINYVFCSDDYLLQIDLKVQEADRLGIAVYDHVEDLKLSAWQIASSLNALTTHEVLE